MSGPGSTREPIPIACTLDAQSMVGRADEWRAFVRSSVTAIEIEDTSVRLVLHDSDAALVAAASLGAREKSCCAFFGVDIEIRADELALRFSVPTGAEEALASFAEILTQ